MIDCQNKSVIFRILHKPEFKFIGEPKISEQKYQGNYTTIEGHEKSIQALKKFMNAFLEDLSGLPSN